jgi:hypothetical protein
VLWAMPFKGTAIALFASEEGVLLTAAVRNYLRVFVAVLLLDTAATATRTVGCLVARSLVWPAVQRQRTRRSSPFGRLPQF